MFIGFNLRLDESAEIFYETDSFEELKRIGKCHLNAQKVSYEKRLMKYINQNEIDGTQIQNEWFPQIDADIFISHSHKDEELACALAGWINKTFQLNCFIDANVWGYSTELLDEMNGKLSDRRKKETGGYIYDYESCNQVSQHVNTMLSIALQKMIDKVETVIFLNTDNSVRVYNDTQMEKTYSPWIYSEIVCTQIVRKKPLLAYRNYLTVEKEYFGIYESVQFAMHSSISYTVSLKHLKKLTERDLECWDREYCGKKQKYEYALDALYEFVCPDEVNGTKRMFSRLESSEIKTLQNVYSIQKESAEEAEEIQSAWNEILDKYLGKCLECERCGIAGCE